MPAPSDEANPTVSFARELAEHQPELEYGFDRALTDRIRREFFARAAASAERYGVTQHDVLTHLRDAHLALTPGPARVLSFLDDVVLTVACVRGHPRAWHDAWQRNESPLIRACHARLDDAGAVIFARRFWIELFTTTMGRRGEGEHPWSSSPHLGTYVGVRPLRIWLTDRLMGVLENAVVLANRVANRASSSGDPMVIGREGMQDGLIFRALRRRSRLPRTDIRLRLVD